MAISVFLSYSRKDEATVQQLESDLARGRVTVWRDAELRGGDLWWQKILEQIRTCDVFVLALSNNGLASKPCRAEFNYARDLGLPVLPVQIGPVDSLRTAAVGEMQVVEYREQTGATGIALFAELEEAARRRGPLPDPLPPAPSVPFAYLLRLGSEIEKEALTPTEQGELIGELRSCLETEDDEGVKDDARELLRALRRRPDVTFRYAGEVDALLVGAPAQPTADQPTVPVQPGPSQQGASSSAGASARPATAGSGATAASVQTPVQTPVQAPAPPPGQGPHGYGVPPPRYGAPPPPAGPGYPPTTYHPTPAAPTRTGGSRLPLLLVLGALLVAIVSVGGVLLINRNDAGPGPGPTTGPSSTGPHTSPPTSPSTSPAGQLLTILPAGFDPASCAAQVPPGPGNLAALTCGPALSQPGPVSARFTLVGPGSADDAFMSDVTAFSIRPLDQNSGEQCPDSRGYGDYNDNGELTGRVACWVGQDNASYVMWSEDAFDAEALVTIPNGGDQGVYTLWSWWRDSSNSAFQG